MSKEIYLDNNATTKPIDQVRAAMMDVLGDGFGNPSSTHAAGERGRRVLESARQSVADLIGAAPSQIIFNSGGTEGNNTVLRSVTTYHKQPKPCRIVTITSEHSSVLRMTESLKTQGVTTVFVSVDRDGLVDLEQLDQQITPDTTLVSVQWVNNETGVIQPIAEIGELCQARGVLFHTDACQAAGKLDIRAAEHAVDFLTLTGHKIHAPQGIGALYAREPAGLVPTLFGGPQEASHRPGTENLPGIAGLGAAVAMRSAQFENIVVRLGKLRDEFEGLIRRNVADVSINGNSDCRVCNTTNLCFHGVDGQALVAQLDQAGIRCSQSSACTNQRPEPSYVLRAMGLSEEDAYASVRFSFSIFNTSEEIETAATAIGDIIKKLRKFASKIRNPYHATRA